MSDDLIQSVEEMSSTLLTIEKVLDIEKIKKEISDLEIQASAPNLWDDQSVAQVITT